MSRVKLCLLSLMFMGVAQAADQPTIPDGKYLLSYSPNPTLELRVAILKFTTKDSKTTGEVVFSGTGQRKWEISDIKVNKSQVNMKAVIGPNNISFEGLINPKNPKEILGSLGDDRMLFRAYLVTTELEELASKDSTITLKPDPAFADVTKMKNEIATTRNKAFAEKDKDARKDLQEKVIQLQKELDEKQPAMLAEALGGMKDLDSASAYFATIDILGAADKSKAKPEKLKTWIEAAMSYADKHGPRFASDATSKIIVNMSQQESLAKLAIGYAEKAIKDNEKSPASVRVKFMKALASAQEKSGDTAAAKKTSAEVEKMEVAVDEEYRKTAIPFKVQKYSGRTNKDATQVAVMELFTGAQCPPCVAADVAFDALHKAYDHKDLILIQYHMHIPGPDPLTNPAATARWDYYREKYPMEIRGTPTTIFNGKPGAGGGGGMGNAKNKFDDYTALIDEILEKKCDYKFTGSAKLTGNDLGIKAKISGLKNDTKATVRFLLLEEEVRYVGGNGLRLHHMVVRSDFNMKDGKSAKDLKDGALEAQVNINTVRKSLNDYLTDFAKNAKFSNPDRPLSLKHLKVVGILQDDESKEILQAVQFDVAEAVSSNR